jgi:NTE family protein
VRPSGAAQLCLALSCTLAAFSSAGCVMPLHWPYTDIQTTGSSLEHSRANYGIDEKERKDGLFIGLALSGGGSRSAVFASAVMLELKRLGILEQVDFISAVSGGALPAAYYVLEGYQGLHFNAPDVLERMGVDFQGQWLARWLYPQNVIRYWFTDFTRSDIMVQVLDDTLFHGATYADLNPERSKLLINTTNAKTGTAFVFSDEQFAMLHSSLSRFSIARAVHASSAYPGIFQNVTLKHYPPPPQSHPIRYLSLYDGGPVDNLGVNALLEVLRQAAEQAPLETLFPKGCVIISVDATPRPAESEADVIDAPSVMLLSNRRGVL